MSSDVPAPWDLAVRIIDSIPTRYFNTHALVPCSGFGVFALAMIYRGWDPAKITCVEIDPRFAIVTQKWIGRFGVNFVRDNFLSWRASMEFDVVIMNPPYQKSKYSDFYVSFIRQAAKLLKEGGYFSMIAPAKGANPFSRAQSPLSECGWDHIELGIEKYFPNIETVIGHYQGIKGTLNDKLTVVLSDDSFQVKKGTVLPLGSNDKLEYSIIAKIFGKDAKMPFYRAKQEPPKNYVYVSRVIGSWKPDKTKSGAFCLKAFVNECSGRFDGGFINCDSKEQADQLVWAMSRSLVMTFAANQCVKAGFVPPLFWSLTPDLIDCETDEDTFEVLSFTQEEKDYIKQWAIETYK